MRRVHLILISLVSLTVLSSGCTQGNSPELKISQDEIVLDGNQSSEIGVRVKNNYNQTKSFNISLEPEVTEKQYLRILDEGEEETSFDLGDAAENSHTSWKYISLKGMPQNIDPSAVAVDLNIYAFEEGNNQSVDNRTVSVTLAK